MSTFDSVEEPVMIKEFVDSFMRNKETLSQSIKAKPTTHYKELVKMVVEVISSDSSINRKPDATRIHEIDDGSFNIDGYMMLALHIVQNMRKMNNDI